MNKNDCKIVQDLLPNYIDKLTTSETNDFIENHLSECKECTSIYENMKNDFETENKKESKKVINFIKKYNKKMKILKLIILTIVVVYLAILGRKIIIMKKLSDISIQDNINEYSLSYNVYSDDILYEISLYKKNEKYLRSLEFIGLFIDNDTKIEEFGNGKTSNYYIEKENNKKTAVLNYEKDGVLPININKICFSNVNNKRNYLRNIFRSSITTTKLDGINYYCISNIWYDEFGECTMYVSKREGIIKKIIVQNGYVGASITNATITTNYNKSTGAINDEWLEEPDISEYEIIDQ